MTPGHSNPSAPRKYNLNKSGSESVPVEAHAPYNFVSLPETMVTANTPPDQDAYQPGLLTGWFDCSLETCSPTYIRGMLTEAQYREFGQAKVADSEDTEQRKAFEQARAPFFSTTDKKVGGFLAPVIPGSSLRGMTRALVEVISYGRMRWVGSNPTFTHRAVAAQSNDPLKEDYVAVIGHMAANVYAGYLVCEGDQWYIQPALTPKDAGVGGKDRFIKVDDEDIALPGFLNMNANGYRPQLMAVRFEHSADDKPKRAELIEKALQKNKKTVRHAFNVYTAESGLGFAGVLVGSGNMTETGGNSPRHKHYIVMPKNEEVARIPIPEQVIQDYRNGFTPFQAESLQAWRDGVHGKEWGCLGHDKPVFYVLDHYSKTPTVFFFGHSPNFRIPVMLNSDAKKRAASPLDFVPENLRTNPNPDLADAIFGWVEESDGKINAKKVIGPVGQSGGRVSFSDAHYIGPQGADVWYKTEPITPKILASPKVTTFQHYLTQDKELGHDPDKKESLAHYGTALGQTNIRGHKFYWHKGSSPEIEYKEEKGKRPDTQLTRIVPLKVGVRFSFRIHFENLRPEELGVLCWALMLPVEAGQTYRHKIGMGKPLGMGALKIEMAGLHLSRRKAEVINDEKAAGRYEQLFDAAGWFQPELGQPELPAFYIKKFEEFICEKGALPQGKSLASQGRIRELLEMLKWRGADPGTRALEVTDYMEIEREVIHKGHAVKIDEYKERPVLPSADAVFEGWFKEKIDINLMAEAVKQNQAQPLVLKSAVDLKSGDQIKKATVTQITADRNVFFKSSEYDEKVVFVILAKDRDPHDHYAIGTQVYLHVVQAEIDEDGYWLVKCIRKA